MADANTDEDNKDPKTTSVEEVRSLDEVNQIAQRKLEEEDANGDTGTDDESGEDSDAGDDSEKGAGDDSAAGDDKPAAGSDEDKSTTEDKTDTDSKPVETPAAVDKPAAELNSDTTKPGEGKVAIKNDQGVTLYFNNLDEVPVDFTPASYAESMRAAKDFSIKEQKETAQAEQTAKDNQNAATQKAIKALSDSWDKEEASMVADGRLPKEADKRKEVTEEVYTYMEEQQRTKGVTIDSFEQAWKAVQYDKSQAKDAEEQKKLNDMKKKRGGKVLSGGTPSPSNSGKPTVRQGLPPGVSLDQVHARVTSTL